MISQCRIKHTFFSRFASVKDKYNYLPLSHLLTAECFLFAAICGLPSGANLGKETFERTSLHHFDLSEV